MADQGGGTSTGTVMREYRKGNWTVSETMVLIEAKQMDDERRMKRSTGQEGSSEARSKPAELRWKWVEDYCWRKGCLRSQNQCNDKWDNLMRDYKKVRDHERKLSSLSSNHHNEVSYWRMEKNDRKEKNLPSNMLLQIYEALVQVVEKKGAGQRVIAGAGSSSSAGAVGCSAGSNPNIGFMVQPIAVAASLPPMQQHHLPVMQPPPLPLPPPSLQPPPPPQPQPQQEPRSDSSDSDTSEYSDSPAKRRRRGGNGDHHQQGTSTGGTAATASASNSQELGTAISESASIIAEALRACEKREERRHKDLVRLHERRLRIEESKSEINRQGINGLVDAINKLANSILALASSNKNQQSAPK